jgi:phosphoribosylformylglycinamidine cyclo-ligase
MNDKMTYANSGLDYDPIDRFKVWAQKAAIETERGNPLRRLGFRIVPTSRGESAFMLEPTRRDKYALAHVNEGLGTKVLVADAMTENQTFYYEGISQDTIAMVVNDMATLGAFPLSMQMHLAAGKSDWFNDEYKIKGLIRGWKETCIKARCVWGGGETPVLKDIVSPTTCVIAGSADGVTKKKHPTMASDRILPGDAIMIAPHTGVGANGLTLCRALAEKLPGGYSYPLGMGGRTYGQVLLDPTPIYSTLVEDLLDAGVDVHYAVNITGHGWRKFMRAPQVLVYRITEMPPELGIFKFIQKKGNVDLREMYGTFNMGAGFGLFIPKRQVAKAIKVGRKWNLYRAGEVQTAKDGVKKVVIVPQDIIFYGDELKVR